MIRRMLPLLPLLAGGCAASEGSYPSLLPRPIEQRSDAEPVVVPAVAAPDPALDAQLAAKKAELATARSAFDAALDTSKPRIARGRGATAGSDPWLAAQVALGELDGHRAAITDLVQELEALVIARGAALEPPYPALDALRTEAEAELAREREALAALTI